MFGFLVPIAFACDGEVPDKEIYNSPQPSDVAALVEQAVPALAKVLADDKEVEEVRQAAIKSLKVMAPVAKDEVVSALVDALKMKNFGVSQLAGQILRVIDPKSAVKAGVR